MTSLPSGDSRQTDLALPLISVVILNYNRKDSLRECIQSAMELDWPSLEWIVVDNASTDGSPHMVQTEFGPEVQLIRRESNSVTAARNQGFRASRGEFILSLDNDVLLPDSGVLNKGIDLFTRFPQVALLAFRIGDPMDEGAYLHEHWWHPVSFECRDRFFFTSYFPEAAVLIRADAVCRVGGYDEEFFMGGEQGDLALKLIREGYLLLYCPNLTCIETEVRGQLALRKSRIHYLNMRNKLWIAWKHYPVVRGLRYAAGRIGASAMRAYRHGWIGYFLAGVRDGVFAPASIRRQRCPLPPQAWAVYDRVQIGWFVEVPQHSQRASEEDVCPSPPLKELG